MSNDERMMKVKHYKCRFTYLIIFMQNQLWWHLLVNICFDLWDDCRGTDKKKMAILTIVFLLHHQCSKQKHNGYQTTATLGENKLRSEVKKQENQMSIFAKINTPRKSQKQSNRLKPFLQMHCKLLNGTLCFYVVRWVSTLFFNFTFFNSVTLFS